MHPVLFKIGPYPVYSYGAMLALAFLACSFLAKRRAAAIGMDGDKVLDLMITLIVSGVIGGRLMFVLLDLDYFRSRPLDIFKLWEGGLVWYGGFILAVIGGAVFLRIRKMPLLKTADLMMPYVALGQAIGRIGCFLNGCCYGKATTLPIGMVFNPEQGAVLPTQLFESAAMFIVYLILRKRAPSNGRTLFLYLMLYSAFRFSIEFLRGDNMLTVMGLTFSQAVSIVIFATAVILWKIIPSK
ncbi:MAG: prolipoprotein diacylglyceryl transferase [Candidatus Omnitrophica bacterium]|nr:prolipoprotein diacylglyceryl transferase [Candidatus Omnitrophota bacterium]